MILRYHHLTRQPAVFRAMTGLAVAEFDALAADVLPRYAEAERVRLGRAGRQDEIARFEAGDPAVVPGHYRTSSSAAHPAVSLSSPRAARRARRS